MSDFSRYWERITGELSDVVMVQPPWSEVKAQMEAWKAPQASNDFVEFKIFDSVLMSRKELAKALDEGFVKVNFYNRYGESRTYEKCTKNPFTDRSFIDEKNSLQKDEDLFTVYVQGIGWRSFRYSNLLSAARVNS